MAENKGNSYNLECPCCGAKLTVDTKLRKVVSHEAPVRQTDAPDLDHAASLLREQAAKREAIFKQSSEELKIKSQLLERKFEEAFKKTKDQPVTKPTRDIDL